MADEERKGGHYVGMGGQKSGVAKRVAVHVRVCVCVLVTRCLEFT
jgi:hypothetical protein